jgi:hypothetical protein
MLHVFPRRRVAVAAAAMVSLLMVSVPQGARADESDDHAAAAAAAGRKRTRVLWLDHFALLPGASELTTSFNSTSSCPGFSSCLTGLVIESSTPGEVFLSGGNKVVHMATGVPIGWDVTGVRVCYELSSRASFISQIRLAQVQNPPSSAVVLLDDGTDLTNPGPVCVNSAPPFAGKINPEPGSLLLSLRLNYGDTADRIVVRGLGLLLRRH